LLAVVVERNFMRWIVRELRHVRGTILHPSVQRYRERTVSRHVGTQGIGAVNATLDALESRQLRPTP